jgi:uncharacterized membrane protein
VSGRDLARWALGVFLIVAGAGHFLATEAFLAQTPTWLPARVLLVHLSGAVEILLGVALWVVSARRRQLGWVVAAFFVAVFPGNVHQAVTGIDAFGLDSPSARWGRLAFQPLFVLWALWSTGPFRAAGDGAPPPAVGRDGEESPS